MKSMKLGLCSALLIALAACGGGDGTPTTPTPKTPTPPAQVWPVVYDLSTLHSPYMPGSVYTRPTTCSRVLRSSLEQGTLTLKQDGTAEVYLRAWEEAPTTINAPGIPCPTFFVRDLSATKGGTYTVSGTGAARSVSVTIGATQFATGTLGESGYPTALSLSVPGYSVFGIGKPFDAVDVSGWTRRP